MGNTGPGGDEEGGSATLKAGSAGERVVVEVDDEFPERFRNAESWEETISWRVESPRGTICQVVTAGDVTRDKKALVSARDVVDPSEDFVDLPTSTPAPPPAFDDTTVVAKDSERLAR